MKVHKETHCLPKSPSSIVFRLSSVLNVCRLPAPGTPRGSSVVAFRRLWCTLPPMLPTTTIDGHSLTLDVVAQVARNEVRVALDAAARARMAQSRAWVEALVARGEPVYGINTGFGIFAERNISADDPARLQRN